MVIVLRTIAAIAVLAAIPGSIVGLIILARRITKKDNAQKQRTEVLRASLPIRAESVRGQVTARRSGSNGMLFVCFRSEDGRTLWARSGDLYNNTAVGDCGTVRYLGDSVLDFERTEALTMSDCPAVYVGRKILEPEHTVVFRSEAFAFCGGTMALKCAGEDFREWKEGDAGVLAFCGDRLQHFKVTGFRAMEYEAENKPGPEANGPVRGRIVWIETDNGDDITTYTVIYLLDNGMLLESGDEKDKLPGDYGAVTWKHRKILGPQVETFSRERRLETRDCPAVLLHKIRRKTVFQKEYSYYLTFYAGAFELYGGNITVKCAAEDFGRFREGDIGALSIGDGNKLLDFRPGNIGVR